MASAKQALEFVIKFKKTGAENLKGVAGDIAAVRKAMGDMDSASTKASKGSGRFGAEAGKAGKASKGAASDVKKYGDEAERAGEKANKGGRDSEGLVASLGKIKAGALAAVGALAGIGAAVVNSSRDIGEAYSQSQKLGMSFEDLAALQKVAFVESAMDAERLVDGLTDMQSKIAEMQLVGSGGAVDFFEVLGHSVEEFAAMNPGEQLAAVADALKDMPHGERNAFLDQLGSDNLRDLAPMLEKGGDELRRMVDEAKNASGALSGLDAKRVEEANTAWRRMSTMMKGFSNSLTVALAPAITWVLDKIEAIGEHGDVFDKIKIGAVLAFGGVKDIVQGLYLDVKALTLTISSFMMDILGEFPGFIFDIQNKVYEGIEWIVNSIVSGWRGVLGILGRVSTTARMAAESLEDFSFDIPEISPEQFKRAASAIREELADTKEAQEELNKVIEEGGSGQAMVKALEERRAANRAAEEENRREQQKTQDERIASAAKTAQELSVAERNWARARAKMMLDISRAAEKEKLEVLLSELDYREKMDLASLDRAISAGKLKEADAIRERARIEKEYRDRRYQERLRLIEKEVAAEQAAYDKLFAALAAKGIASRGADGAPVIADSLVGDSETNESAIQLVEAYGRLNGLLGERNRLNDSNLRENALGTLRVEEQIADIQRKSAEESKADAERRRQTIEQARRELLRLDGKESEAAILDLQDRWGKALEEMGDDAEGSEIIEKLLDRSKAKVILDEMETRVKDLQSKLESGEISDEQYRQGVAEAADRAKSLVGDNSLGGDVDQEIEKSRAKAEEGISAMSRIGRVAGQTIQNHMALAFNSIADGSKTAGEAFRDMARSMLADMAAMIARLAIIRAMNAAFGVNIPMGSMSAGGMGVGVMHTGGMVGAASTRRLIDPSIFHLAPRFHTGGVIPGGLKPGEVPIIAQEGERVLSRQQNKAYEKGMQGGERQVVINNLLDTDDLYANAAGSRTFADSVMNVIRSRKSETKGYLR